MVTNPETYFQLSNIFIFIPSSLFTFINININPSSSITISGLAILQSPRAVDPQKSPQNVVFNANLFIIEGSETGTMGLLQYFASNEMTVQIQKKADKPYQKAFIVAHVNFIHYRYDWKKKAQNDSGHLSSKSQLH